MKLGKKITLWFLVIGILPTLILAFVALTKSTSALGDESFSKLEAVRSIRTKQIEAQMKYTFSALTSYGDSLDTMDFYGDLKTYHDKMNTGATEPYDISTGEYQQIWQEHGKRLYDFCKKNGYYDVFMVCAAHGHVMYTATKEADLGTNLRHGPYRDSSLRVLLDKVIKTNRLAFVDFAPYAPSNGEPAAFAGVPIHAEGSETKVIGMLAVQLSIDAINEIMQQRNGMGKTGESYLVGTDQLMRSDSFLDKENHSVKASFKNPNIGKVDTEASRRALSGESGTDIIIDYNGNPVLSSYAPLDLYGVRWAVIAEIDEAEVLIPIDEIRNGVIIILVISVILIIAVGFFVSRQITRPIIKIMEVTKLVASGDLTQKTEVSGKDEVAELGAAINTMASNLSTIIGNVRQSASALSSASSELSATSTQLASSSEELNSQSNTVAAAGEEMSTNLNTMASSSEEVSASMSTVASAIEEMSASVQEVAVNCEKESSIAKEALVKSADTRKVMSELSLSADEIGQVVELIENIADQTNLLALNATIEAASAGEAGKGFAVVASEVKQLARETADATKKIGDQVRNIQSKTQSSVASIEAVNAIIEDVSQIANSISASVEEQSATTSEISRNISEVNSATQEIVQNINHTSAGSVEVSSNIQGVKEASGQVSSGATELNASASELSRMSEKLNEMVAQFKL